MHSYGATEVLPLQAPQRRTLPSILAVAAGTLAVCAIVLMAGSSFLRGKVKKVFWIPHFAAHSQQPPSAVLGYERSDKRVTSVARCCSPLQDPNAGNKADRDERRERGFFPPLAFTCYFL